MRYAYAALGLAWLIIIVAGAYAFNRTLPQPGDTGPQDITRSQELTSMATSTLTLTSPAFANNGSIPSQFTCDGDRTLSPALAITGVPGNAKSLALIMDDPDVPKALHADGVFDHWVLFNLPAGRQAFRIEEGEVPEGAIVGTNGAGKNAYTGPCPPPQYEPSEHRYIFKLYALDAELPLQTGATKEEVEKAMEGHVIAQTQLVGRYKRI